MACGPVPLRARRARLTTMCGLSAIVDFGGGAGLGEELLAMHARIAHRGPDGEGFCVVTGGWDCRAADEPRLRAGGEALRAGFGFRWLQIQDASPAAAQPMASADGSVRLLFNGEIYNFRELREELRGLGHAFASSSDTEVILVAYLRWGLEAFSKLEGMWAILLLDLPRRKLVVSRDRLGIKPLFYQLRGRRLYFASELKQLIAAGAPAQANLPAVTRFLRGARPSEPEETFFRDIRAIPAAAYAQIDLQGGAAAPRFESYWRLEEKPASAASYDEACRDLDAMLRRSVSEHMVGPVPMGVLVSGGLDSSLVAAHSAASFAQRGERGLGFSMVLDRGEGVAVDESEYIDGVVGALGLKRHTVELRSEWLKERIAELTLVQEEPVAGPAVAGQYATFALAARHRMKVMLDGQGADELFGGYPRHRFEYLAEAWKRFAVVTLAFEGAMSLVRDRELLREAWRSAGGHAARPDLDYVKDDAPVTAPGAAIGGRSALDRALRRDVLAGNLRAVLALTDRNAMAHSIEARVPYVHRPLVEFAFTLPDAFKVGSGRRKRILRDVGARYLPRRIVTRTDRIGFGVPTRRWLQRDFAAELRALARGPAFAAGRIVDCARLQGFVDGFLADRHVDGAAIWRLYAVDQWARAYRVAGL